MLLAIRALNEDVARFPQAVRNVIPNEELILDDESNDSFGAIAADQYSIANRARWPCD